MHNERLGKVAIIGDLTLLIVDDTELWPVNDLVSMGMSPLLQCQRSSTGSVLAT